MKRNKRQPQEGCELSPTDTSSLLWAPSSTGSTQDKQACSSNTFHLSSWPQFIPPFSLISGKRSPLHSSLLLPFSRPSRCLAQWRQQQQQQQWERGPEATRWGSPTRIGMLTLYPSPSAETDLFDLRCDCVFSSPHLQLPLNRAPTHSPTPFFFGPSLINCFNLAKHSSSCYCFSTSFIFSLTRPACQVRVAVTSQQVGVLTDIWIQWSHELERSSDSSCLFLLFVVTCVLIDCSESRSLGE